MPIENHPPEFELNGSQPALHCCASRLANKTGAPLPMKQKPAACSLK
ncbi:MULTISPECIES: hypothetical protein [Pseudomonas]|nr:MULTISPECIES: hypothetical protein [Pseudomonas]